MDKGFVLVIFGARRNCEYVSCIVLHRINQQTMRVGPDVHRKEKQVCGYRSWLILDVDEKKGNVETQRRFRSISYCHGSSGI